MATRTRTRRRRVTTPYPVPLSPPTSDLRVYLIDEDAGPGLHAASSKELQGQFGQMIGFIFNVVLEGYEAITREEATILADAANHLHLPYGVSAARDGYYIVSEITSESFQPTEMCPCPAHQLLLTDPEQDSQLKDDIRLLIRSKSPLTDDGGKLFASSMLSRILSYAGSAVRLQTLSAGTERTVSFILK